MATSIICSAGSRSAGWNCEELNEMRTLDDNPSPSDDRLTIAATAITACLCSVVIHEAGGHAKPRGQQDLLSYGTALGKYWNSKPASRPSPPITILLSPC